MDVNDDRQMSTKSQSYTAVLILFSGVANTGTKTGKVYRRGT